MSISNPLAALIRAWADGATVQFRPRTLLLLEEWRDLPVVSECGDVPPMFNTRLFEYRVKPEDTSKQWRPKEGESFWLVGYDGDIYQSDALPNLNRKVIDIGNCFPASIKGHEEAEAAAERFKAILKDESLKLKNSEPNRTNFQLDGKPLSDGEIALIRATRSSRICRFYEDFLIVEKHDNGVAAHRTSLAFFTQYPCDDAKIKAAIQQIIKEQEARNGNA